MWNKVKNTSLTHKVFFIFVTWHLGYIVFDVNSENQRAIFECKKLQFCFRSLIAQNFKVWRETSFPNCLYKQTNHRLFTEIPRKSWILKTREQLLVN